MNETNLASDNYLAFYEKRKNQGLLRELSQNESERKDTARLFQSANQVRINFSSNDYLGLSRHKLLARRSGEWAMRYGTGAGASRLVTGNMSCLEQVETKIANFKNMESALVFPSGFQANATILQALLDPSVHGTKPLVFSDRLNHASMHFGCHAAGIRQIRYRHCDAEHLEKLLAKHTGNLNQSPDRTKKDILVPRFILTESIFSMDGDAAPLDHIVQIAKKYRAFLIIDDAHGFGITGMRGNGACLPADIVIGTFSKAAGSMGAYAVCSRQLKEYLVNKCSGLIYSTALSPALLGAIDAALEIIPHCDRKRKKLVSLSQKLRSGLEALGFSTLNSIGQIIPVLAGDEGQALTMQASLKNAGFEAIAIRPPTVPKGSARLRLTCNSDLKEKDIDNLLYVFNQIKRQSECR